MWLNLVFAAQAVTPSLVSDNDRRIVKLNKAKFTDMGPLSRDSRLMFQLTHLIKVPIVYLVGWLKNKSKDGLLVETEMLVEEGNIKTPRNWNTGVDMPRKTYLLIEKGSRMSFTNTDFFLLKLHLSCVLYVHEHVHPILSVEVGEELAGVSSLLPFGSCGSGHHQA